MSSAVTSTSDSTAPGNSQTFKKIATKYFLSCTAALVAETVTYPLDITKTRLQIARNKFTKGGMVQVTYDIIRREGAMALWTGVAPAITRHYIYTGIRMGAYEQIRLLTFNKEVEKSFPLWKSMLCGAFSGLIAQFAASPTDLVKVQMQMEGLRRLQKQPLRYTGATDCFRSLYRTQGFFGLWIGWMPNCQRAALLNMADIATYDSVKHGLIDNFELKDNWLTHAVASACAGLAAAIVSLPSDVVKTRMMDQIRHELDAKMMHKKNTHVDLYKGVVDCYIKIIKNEGFFSLYKGFLPSYIRMAPWSLTFWVSYEEIRKWTGASSF
ncbi:UnCoupling Protein (mitochondrial substrate carrier) [Caenorhabditis elegans]|uniref:UnCoupling Protein (Mitochondrial substrate carrier) n=1 Tax=Caenorhabditis elegans TaxID=6239 RepID=O01883_CAEEL|nr:UnCoupling Protein (mitochondrial substrate carrier) [Caenorhabditis elegans]CCD68613.1 UnCoupling Protein (mitochondrial substrate carrier) [Caenorhabditis elegans]|eukprot:NP_505414.1 UnCoupling Protein (mitochondrial substrate carrier) [Caenorhabditis elegans]